MIVYMLRDNETGLFYRRTKGGYSDTLWVEQQKASIWTMKIGPAQSKSRLQDRYHGRYRGKPPKDLEIISFTLTENNV